MGTNSSKSVEVAYSNTTTEDSDQRHRFHIDNALLDDYVELASHLAKDCTSDIDRLCSIFSFIGLECLGDRLLDGRARRETPRAYMKSIREGHGRYAYFFAILCRKVGIPCVLIPGIAKTSRYATGDADLTTLRSLWTAVHVGGDWRFVHPCWAFKTVSGYHGEMPREFQETDDELFVETMNRINHFWFLTDAEHLIFWCLPDDSRWQILGQTVTTEQFTRQLHVTDAFFEMGVRILNYNSCAIETSTGYVEIIMQIPENTQRTFTVSYEFTRRVSGEKVDEASSHCLAMIRDFPLVKFKLRAPFADSLIMKIFGSNISQPKKLDLLCSFRIDCSKAMKFYIPFPESPYYGWGAGYETERCGVTAISHKAGLFTVTSAKPFVMKFQLQKFVELIADLVGECEKYEPTFTTKGDKVNMLVKLPPVNKEYGIVLYAKNTQTGFFCNAVNYIIRRNVPDTASENTEQSKK